ncbi:MAG: hypothetical protein R3D62_04355 [Xanthobacteraceae bacterium]
MRAALVFAGTMTLLLMPKLLAYLVLLRRPGELHRYGGALRAFVSLLIETVVSGLIAPVMMVMQSTAVSEILVGKDSGWQVQRRDDGRLPFRVLARSYLGHTTVGVLLAAAAIAVSWPLFLWMTPVIVGLVLAIPLAAVTASAAFGRGLQRLGLLATPEERDPPEVLQRANALARMVECDDDVTAPILRLLRNPDMVAAHRAMLRPRARQRGEVDVALVVGLAKLDDIDSLDDALQILTRRELAAVLGDGRGLDRLIEVSSAAPVRGAAG